VELVVVDDGSTEATTLSILAQLERHGIHVIRQPKMGPSAAVMAGLEATSAFYVMRLDADDLLERGALDALVAALDSAPLAAASWGDVQTFGMTTFRVPTAPALDPWLVTYVNCVPGAGCLFRRSALVEAGGWQVRDGFEDWDVWMSLAELGYAGVYLPLVTFHYRRDQLGRQAESVARTSRYYEELRNRHPKLFGMRHENRRRSPAPRTLKIAVRAVDALPGLSRLAKVQLCELFTHLFWNGGLRVTTGMALQAVALRTRRHRLPFAKKISQSRNAPYA